MSLCLYVEDDYSQQDQVKVFSHEGDGENTEHDLHDIKTELERDAETAEVTRQHFVICSVNNVFCRLLNLSQRPAVLQLLILMDQILLVSCCFNFIIHMVLMVVSLCVSYYQFWSSPS